MDYIVHGILQARILEWVAFSSSRESSQPRDQTQVSPLQADSLPAKPQGELPNPSLFLLPHDRPINWETRYWGKEYYYSESQLTKKMAD